MTLNHNTQATLLPIDHCFRYIEKTQDKENNDKFTSKAISLYIDVTLGDNCFYRAEVNTMKAGKVKNCLTLTVNYDCSITVNYNHERITNREVVEDDLISEINLTYSKLGLTFLTMIDGLQVNSIIDPSFELLPKFWNLIKTETKIDDQSRLKTSSIKLTQVELLTVFASFDPVYENHKQLPIAVMADHAKSKLEELTVKASTKNK